MILSASACSKDADVAPVIEEPSGEKTPVQYDVPFGNVPNTADIVMYEVNLWAFSADANLNGVKAKLDHIKNLGINVIWLMPIYPIGEVKGVGSPYAIKNYTEVNARFGNLENLRLLVKEAHSRDMAVILDWVGNHTSWDNPWIQNTAWYTKDGSGNIISPAGMGWNDVADLNFGSQAMRKEMIKSMKYWVLEANVDGYRCDYADGVPTDFWKQAIDTLRKIPNRKIVMFAEGRKKEMLTAGFDLIFGWNFYEKIKEVYNDNTSASGLVTVNNADYSGIPAGKHILRWITNHDDNAWNDTPNNIFKDQSGAKAAFVTSIFMGGVPLIYNGQEVGFPTKLPFFNNSNVKIDWTLNPDILTEYKKLIAFRKSSNAVKTGTIEAYNSDDVMAFKRISGTEEVLVIVNLRNTTKDLALQSAIANASWTNAMTDEAVDLTTSISLPPYTYLILKK
jgi:glycosidase